MSGIAEQVGNTIRESRKKAGITQIELAEKLGLSQAAVNRYESGKQNLTIDTVQKIASALKTEININFKP